jgi:uncharacterized glyoxalase superfamily protein PhnB
MAGSVSIVGDKAILGARPSPHEPRNSRQQRINDGHERLPAQHRHPDEIGGFETQSAYVVVADADAVHARAKAEGWTIVIALKDEDYGGRGFSCLDPEGRLWNVGTYDPWA